MTANNWTCPFCCKPQTVTKNQCVTVDELLPLTVHKYGEVGIQATATACANPDCKEVTLTVLFTTGIKSTGHYGTSYTPKQILETYPLRPASSCRPQPEYIPEPLRQDYIEACNIRDLSPKASATLSRRCIQGMIRDFCGISKSRLLDEIKALRKAYDDGNAPKGVELEAIEAIDHVRSVGNIGAHMEEDINKIIDVDPGEAQELINLIEMLFEEWYIARHSRQANLDRIRGIADQKSSAKAALKKVVSP